LAKRNINLNSFSSLLVTGRSAEGRSMHDSFKASPGGAKAAFRIKLFQGSVWGIRKRQLLKRVWADFKGGGKCLKNQR
jgi:hypothetical protein